MENMLTFFETIYRGLSQLLFTYDYHGLLKNELYSLLCSLNPNFIDSFPYGLISFLCGIIIFGFVYLLIRVVQQLIGIISKIIGGLF